MAAIISGTVGMRVCSAEWG